MKRFLAGLALGVSLTLIAVYGFGEQIGARIIAVGVQLANAGSTPLWEVQIRPTPPESPSEARNPIPQHREAVPPVARPISHASARGGHSR